VPDHTACRVCDFVEDGATQIHGLAPSVGMKHWFSVLALVAMTASAAAADSSLALDYRASDASCIDAARFADEVAAKLGFVPFKATASAKIRVRVERDGDHFTGSVINIDGTSKIIDGATCAAVTSKLAVTVAGAVDSSALVGAKAPPPPPAPPAGADSKIPVTFESDDGRRIDVSVNVGGGTGVASNGTAVVTNFYEGLCTTPCTARLAAGRQYVTFQDPDARAFGGERFLLDGPTKITLHYESRSGARRGWFFGSLALTAASVAGGYVIGGAPGIVLGTTGASLGLTGMMIPLFLHDTFTTTRTP
jgi:hypothetical protein